MKKEFQELKESPKAKIHLDSHRATQKKYKIGKRQAMRKFMNTGSRNPFTSTWGWQSKWTDAWNKQTYMNTLIQKDHRKGTSPNNFRTITTCLPMMGKILTTQIRMEIYWSLISQGLFPEEQKGTRRSGDILYMH